MSDAQSTVRRQVIVLVEDDPSDTFFARQALQEANVGNPLFVFESAAAARRHLVARPSEPPALLMLDIHLQGGETGLDLLRWVRRQPPPLRITPAIMLTGSHQAEHRLTGNELGILGFLQKPVTNAQLAAAVRALGFEILADALTGRLWFRIAERGRDADAPGNGAAVEHWKRVHSNGWTAEVWIADDGRYYHRTYEGTGIPEDDPDSEAELIPAENVADARVAAHVCDCPPWEPC
jgi:CheY-like chemotaxis protein